MTREALPGEPVITQALVRRLLAAQHPDLATLPVGETMTGWDNTLVRLGDDLALRLPRRDLAERLMITELEWLPRVRRQTGIPVPAPLCAGVPERGHADNYPYHWAIVPWTSGRVARTVASHERDGYALKLARTLAALHQPAPPKAPESPVGRGQNLDVVRSRIEERLALIRGRLAKEAVPLPDGGAVTEVLGEVLAQALAADAYAGPARWLHGDPHPGNTVLTGTAGTPGAPGPSAPPGIAERPGMPVLIDFGDLCCGDPASDLGMMWDHFTPKGLAAFRAAYVSCGAGTGSGTRAPTLTDADAGTPSQAALWTRARGWALHYALIYLDPERDESMQASGRRMLDTIIAERSAADSVRTSTSAAIPCTCRSMDAREMP